MYSFYKNKKRKIHILEKIEEEKIFLGINENKTEYNEYNQINIIDKLYEVYVSIIKFVFNYKN